MVDLIWALVVLIYNVAKLAAYGVVIWAWMTGRLQIKWVPKKDKEKS